MRWVGERRAVAAAVLGFFGSIYFLLGLLAPPAFMAVLLALALLYYAGFFGVVAGWFWARWYAMGLAFYGLITAAIGIWQIGLETPIIVLGVSHGLVAIALAGKGPSSAFDGRRDWRERMRMDDDAAGRLGKTIMRAGASLPFLVVAGLAPKQGMGMGALAGALAVALGVLGLHALVRLRTWGLFALAGAAGLCLTTTDTSLLYVTDVRTVAWGAAALLVAAVVPFAGPLWHALAVDRRA